MIYSNIMESFILLYSRKNCSTFVSNFRFMERLINYVNSIFPCGMPYLSIDGYSFEWIGTHWNLVGVSEPTSLDISEFDLENEV